MLECAIPNCCAQERALRSGTLHLADVVRDDGRIAKKMIWLCAGCTLLYSVQTWRPPGEQIRLRVRSRFNVVDILSARAPQFQQQPATEPAVYHAPPSPVPKLRYASR